MTAIPYILGLIVAVALIGSVVSLMLIAGAQSEQKRKQDVQTKNIVRQPWDAQSADGRGNR